MLTKLKTLLEGDTAVAVEDDSINDRVQASDIRDMFLSGNKAAVAIGAENDPTIAKFIESIPEDDELDPVSSKDIEKIAESMVPVLNEAYEPEADSAIHDEITSGDYNEFDDITPMSDKNISTPYSDESDSAFDDEISSGSYDEFVG